MREELAPPTASRASRRFSPAPGWAGRPTSAALLRVPTDAALAAALAAVTLIVRLVFAAARPTDWDSVQFVEGLRHYDVTHGSPHPPGYFLYEVAGRTVMAITGFDGTASLVVVAAVASAAAAGVLYLTARQFLGRWLSVGAVALVATSPVAWYAGSMVNTYSFDALASALMLLLARRATPGGRWGAAACATLAVLSGFRQSLAETMSVLALVAVVATVRRPRHLAACVAAGVAGLAVWMVPLALVQPGGLSAWYRATRLESSGAFHASSLLAANHGAGRVNFGTLAAYTVILLGPAVVVAVIGGVARMVPGDHRKDPSTKPAVIRPWYQTAPALLVAALAPAVIIYTLVEFGKGGYALAFVPATTITLLASVASPGRWAGGAGPAAAVSAAVAAVVIVAAVAINTDRFTAGAGVVPAFVPAHLGGLWLGQARYGAPYPETHRTIETADRADRQLQALAAHIRPGDQLIYAADQPGLVPFRNVGWALPDVEESFVTGSSVLYQQLHGLLYYSAGATLPVRPGTPVFLLVSNPAGPDAAALSTAGDAADTGWRAAGWQVWRVRPGTAIGGVTVTMTAAPPPLAGSIGRPAPAA